MLRRGRRLRAGFSALLASGALLSCDTAPDLHLGVSANLPERADYRVTRVVRGWRVAPEQTASYAARGALLERGAEVRFRVAPAGPLPRHRDELFSVQRRVPVATGYHRAGHVDSALVLVRFAREQHAERELVFYYRPVLGAGGGPGGPAYEFVCTAPPNCRVASAVGSESLPAGEPEPAPSERLHDSEWGDAPMGATRPPLAPSCAFECDTRTDAEREASADGRDAGAADATLDARDASTDADADADAGMDVGAPDVAAPPAVDCRTQPEQCDGLDNNCDGRVDEICPCEPDTTQRCYGGDPRHAGVGVCWFGRQRCVRGVEFGSWGACMGYGTPRAARCVGADDRCSGVEDDSCACDAGASRGCYTGPDGTEGVGLCRGGTQSCVTSGGRPLWGACVGQTLPAANTGDGLDRACTGDASWGVVCLLGTLRVCYSGPAVTRRVGGCSDGVQRCVLGPDDHPVFTPCAGDLLPAARETCGNSIDDDCDGAVDEGC